MSFKDLDPILKSNYNSLYEDIVKKFYVPVLKEAKRYDRVSGYFDSSSLAIAAKGMGDFILNGGKMRLLCGAKLFPQDLETIKNASDAKDIVSDRFLEDLDNIEDELINNHIKVLGWMIKHNILEIKVGFNKKDGQYLGGGILHSKTGIFWDNEGSDFEDDLEHHCIVFNGSNNETAAGWTSNFETFDVFRGPIFRDHMMTYVNDFPKMWNGDYPYLEVMDIPEADKRALIDKSPDDIQELKRIIKKYYGGKKDDRSLFEHQSDAIDYWFKNNKRGIFEMATGTGKTFTAINCLEKLSEEEKDLITVIACPYAHLVEQWQDEIKKFGFDKIYVIYGMGNPHWKKDLSRLVKRINRKKIKKAIILTTHKSFARDFFKDKISEINSNLFVIADEMHHLASEQYSTGLLEDYKYRLGLSATPEKFMDEEATIELQDYFGGIVYTFDLEDAINKVNPVTHLSYLTPYDYIPEKINLTSEELTDYKDLTRKIGAFSNRRLSSEEQEVLNSLLRKRKYILNNAEEKYDKLREILRRYGTLDHLIIFCSPQQIKKVLKILKEEGVKPRHRFSSKEKARKYKKLGGRSYRQILLEKFDKGEYKALVAMKCLNEGVDVPSADKVIIMSSTTNPIEYVQRRGRVLRRYPGKELAYIYDMVIVPDDPAGDSIIQKEMERMEEFITIANNRDECNDKLNEWGVLN